MKFGQLEREQPEFLGDLLTTVTNHLPVMGWSSTWVLWVPCKTVLLLFFWKVVLFFWLAFWLAVKYWLFWGDEDSENSKSFLLCEKCFVFFVAIITTCCPSGSSNLQSISERSLFPQAARFSSHSTSDTPWKINMEPNHRSEAWFRWFSFWIGWFLGEPAVFRGRMMPLVGDHLPREMIQFDLRIYFSDGLVKKPPTR